MAPAPESEPADATIVAGAPAERSFASGRYVVQRVLPEGGQKIVYLVHDTALDRDCALALIKTELLEPDDLERLRREARAMARLDHPNIVTVHDIGDEDGRPDLVCQYIAGGDLRQAMRDAGGPLPIPRALAIAAELCAALAHAHAAGIVHRDLKPANVWLTAGGAAKLGDFGLASAAGRSRLTREGTFVGTAAYIAPEQALGGAADARSDLYALGCVLYEMVTGRVPFAGEDMVSVISQHIETAPVAPSWHNPQVPHALDALIVRLLAKSPEDRPQSADALLGMLDALTATRVADDIEPPGANPLDRLAEGVFVGREREVEELRRGLDDALSGRGRLLLLVGEPGIGKTRTASELCTYARLRGAQVLIGRCYEGEGAPAYWPWTQALRPYVSECDPEALQADLGPGAADLAQLLPEVHERIPGLVPPPRLEPDQARFRLFDSITSFLKNASRRQPLVLLLDDLHWADQASLLMLQFLARNLAGSRLLLLGTYRDVELGRQHPLAHTLAELAREQIGTRVLLRGLTAPDATRYIEMTSGVAPSGALAAAVYRETEGNPFFLSEVVRMLVSEGRLERADGAASWTVMIPQSVREVVGRRLDHLSEECNQILTMAAVIGREFPLDGLQMLTPHDADRLLDLLEEGQAARVVEEVGGGPVGRFSFSHALIRETLYDELSTTRRVRLHRQIGEALEVVYAANIEPHVAELAYHFGEAAASGHIEKAVAYSERAASQAHSIAAFEEAVAHYTRALGALELLPQRDRKREFELLLLLALSQRPRAPDEARRTCRRARELGQACESPEMVARATISHERALAAEGWLVGYSDDDVQDHEKLVEEALAGLPPEDGRMRCLLLGRLAGLVAHGRRPVPPSSQAMVDEAVAMARRLGDPDTLFEALSIRRWTLSLPSGLHDRLRLDEEMMSIASSLGDILRLVDANEQLLADLLEMGDISGVDAALARTVELHGNSRWPQAQFWVAIRRTMRALLAGRFADAEGSLAAAAAGAKWSDEGDAAAQMGVPLYLMRREQGRLAEIQGGLETFAARYDRFPAWRAGLAALYAEIDKREDARREFEALARDRFAGLPPDVNQLLALSLLSEACRYLNDRSRAAILYELQLPFADRNVTGLDGIVAVGSASRPLGLLATILERYDDAERHFRDALAMNERMGAGPWVAHTQYDYARMLLARGAAADRARAAEFLAEATATATELGMVSLAQKIDSLAAS